MKAFTTTIAGLGLAATGALAQSSPPPQLPEISMIKSTASNQCAPGSTINVDIQPETLEFKLPAMFFGTTGHGRTDEVTLCDINVEFTSWWYQYRVAIKDVTYSGRLNLTNDVQLYQLQAKANFQYIHLENGAPIVQPEVRNLSTAVMVSPRNLVNPITLFKALWIMVKEY